ncbi:MAG: hypothetical protein ACWA5A_14245 [Marinibacterium sp.]
MSSMLSLWRRIKHIPAIAALAVVALPDRAGAHASEGGLVLLLPTDLYISAGVAAVAATVLAMALIPGRNADLPFRPAALVRRPAPRGRQVTSLLSATLLVLALLAGQAGPRDPLSNPLPLLIWSVWWIVLVALQGAIGNHWRWTNPWTGPAALISWLIGRGPLWRYPKRLGFAPAILTYLGFAAFLLADPAPADPSRLAAFAGAYWLLTLAMTLAFGPVWLVRADGITVMMRAYARISVVGVTRGRLAIGLSGWQVLHRSAPPAGLAVLMVILLATGSFDGLNETFWWFGRIGINPLEFPGRSAVIAQNLAGLAVAIAALLAVFAGTLWLGLKLAASALPLTQAVRLFAPSVLPIALGYHIAHYLTSILVEAQYALAALNDPLARGADLLGLGTFYVTTGFFNTPDTVRAIFLTQAGAVVTGHVVAILLAHALAVRAFGSSRRAALAQAPLALFMIAYTLFGLWLLASPRGI